MDYRTDPRIDIYSFGVTLWKMVHKVNPISELISMFIDGDASEILKHLVCQCVVKEAAERSSSAELCTTLINCGMYEKANSVSAHVGSFSLTFLQLFMPSPEII